VIFIRKAGLDDWPIIHAWENDPALWNITDDAGPFSQDQIRYFLQHQNDITRHKQERWLILLNHLPIGMMDVFQWNATHKSVGVGIVIISGEHRRSGYGYKALHALEIEMKNLYLIHNFWAIVWVGNKKAIEFFLKCGYSLTEEILHQEKKAFKFEKNIK
jgi:diamine N-acetyltransferase